MNPAPPSPDQRIAAWLRTGDWTRLWPDYSMAELSLAQRAISAVARAIARTHQGPVVLAPYGTRPGALGVAAFTSGMGPLLGWYLEKHRLAAEPDVAEVLARHLDEGRKRASILRRELREILSELTQSGVEAVVLKGLHTGSVYFPEPGTRPTADIDLLVHPRRLGETVAVLNRLGFKEARRTKFAVRSEWVRAGRPQKVRDLDIQSASNPWHLDLHCSLERWYFRGTRASLGEDVFDNTTWFEIEGVPARGLNQPHLTALLALHASYELVRTRMIWLLELVWVIRRDTGTGTLEWNTLLDLLRSRALGRFVYPAFALAERLAPGTVDPRVLEYAGREATPRLARVVDAVEGEDFGFLATRSLEDKVMWARGFKELVLNLSEWIWPSDEADRDSLANLYRKRVGMLIRRRARLRAGVSNRGKPNDGS